MTVRAIDSKRVTLNVTVEDWKVIVRMPRLRIERNTVAKPEMLPLDPLPVLPIRQEVENKV